MASASSRLRRERGPTNLASSSTTTVEAAVHYQLLLLLTPRLTAGHKSGEEERGAEALRVKGTQASVPSCATPFPQLLTHISLYPIFKISVKAS